MNDEMGWICPRCGRVNAPWQACCPCSILRKEITCDMRQFADFDLSDTSICDSYTKYPENVSLSDQQSGGDKNAD